MRYLMTVLLMGVACCVDTRADEHGDKLLAANADQLISAFANLKQPLNTTIVVPLKAAIQESDRVGIHKILEDECLLLVSINPEGRVKLLRGPAKISMYTGRTHYALVKIENHSGGQQRLTVKTTYAGSKQNPFAAKFISEGKLTPDLVGLPIEYRILAVTTTTTGKHELTVTVEAGSGTQELGFRGEAPVLIEVRGK